MDTYDSVAPRGREGMESATPRAEGGKSEPTQDGFAQERSLDPKWMAMDDDSDDENRDNVNEDLRRHG